MSTAATSTWPNCAAIVSGLPERSVPSTSAPACRSSAAVEAWFFCAQKRSAVVPSSASVSTAAPAPTSFATSLSRRDGSV
eukprot:scaffold97918_cov63-Phaeocystis_antarctica.AAC.4